MENRDELLDLVNSYINNRDISPRTFSNLFSTRSSSNSTRNIPQQQARQPQQNETERLHLMFTEILLRYNNTISQYQDNMGSLISIFRRLVPQETSVPRSRPPQAQPNPTTFYYTWAPDNQPAFENVVVSPSQEEIERATINNHYDTEDPPINTRCPITLDHFIGGDSVTTIHYCGHTFGSTAFTSWFRTNVRCPVCRYDIREYRERASGDRSNSQRDTSDISNNMNNTQPEPETSTEVPPTIQGLGQNDITRMIQTLISESLTTTLQDINVQTQNEPATFMFDFNFPSINRDLSNNT